MTGNSDAGETRTPIRPSQSPADSDSPGPGLGSSPRRSAVPSHRRLIGLTRNTSGLMLFVAALLEADEMPAAMAGWHGLLASR